MVGSGEGLVTQVSFPGASWHVKGVLGLKIFNRPEGLDTLVLAVRELPHLLVDRNTLLKAGGAFPMHTLLNELGGAFPLVTLLLELGGARQEPEANRHSKI
jgi:hypothetical protein